MSAEFNYSIILKNFLDSEDSEILQIERAQDGRSENSLGYTSSICVTD